MTSASATTRETRRRQSKFALIGAALLLLAWGFPRFAALADLDNAINATGCLESWRFVTSLEKRFGFFLREFNVEFVGDRSSVGEMMVSCGYPPEFPGDGTSRELHSHSSGYRRVMGLREVDGGEFRFTIEATSVFQESTSQGP